MKLEIFSAEWAAKWKELLNTSNTYREAAKSWEWTIALEMKLSDGESRRLILDLWHGQCRNIRVCREQDLEQVDYVISGPRHTWQELLNGRLEPMLALIRGKLKLKKGSLVKLSGYSSAAKILLETAASIPSVFPGNSKQSAVLNNSKPAETESIKVQTRAATAMTRGRTLNRDSFVMQLFEKAKKLGTWNPTDISFKQDKQDWKNLQENEKEVLLHLTSLFLAGEESVTEDILPLISLIARQKRLEEELYLTTFLWEEAKHTDFFNRFLESVVERELDLSRFHTQSYRKLFYEELPSAMGRLEKDSSPEAQINASVTYNMIVEGTLAETGYHAYYEMLESNRLMPGLRKGIGYLKKDESRHIAYGIHLLSRLLGENPGLWNGLQKRMEYLLEIALAIIDDIFEPYDRMPFGLQKEDFVHFALNQFNKRMDKLEMVKEDRLNQA